MSRLLQFYFAKVFAMMIDDIKLILNVWVRHVVRDRNKLKGISLKLKNFFCDAMYRMLEDYSQYP